MYAKNAAIDQPTSRMIVLLYRSRTEYSYVAFTRMSHTVVATLVSKACHARACASVRAELHTAGTGSQTVMEVLDIDINICV